MPIHRALFDDLPPAETLQKMYAGALKQEKNADGYYVIVQHIAERYGERAYEIAEAVFREMGLTFDPQALRIPESVRRVGYNFEGDNIYHVEVLPFRPEMAGEVTRLYNESIRFVTRAAFLTPQYFLDCILPATGGEVLVACSENGQPVGWTHVFAAAGSWGSVEALVFGQGRIYNPVRRALVTAARAWFTERAITSIRAYTGEVAYPLAVAMPDARAAFQQALPHIADALDELTGKESEG